MKRLFYQFYLPAIGDLERAIDHLCSSKLFREGDVIWVGPVINSQGLDLGYDTVDHKQVNPLFGDMAALDRLVSEAHKRGLKIIIDLPLNRTSIAHPWFRDRPEYYYWSNDPHPGWKNTFDGGSAWRFDGEGGQYYLCSRHAHQADLCWFPDGIQNGINASLLKRMKKIIAFWTEDHGIDGFRLGDPAIYSKDINDPTLNLDVLSRRDGGIKLFNALFPDQKTAPLLLMECRDSTFGSIEKRYLQKTAVQFTENALLKHLYWEDKEAFYRALKIEAGNPNAVLKLESHDSARFLRPTVFGSATLEEEMGLIFKLGFRNTGLFIGQEYGISNPPPSRLTDEKLLKLDLQTAARVAQGENISDLRQSSKANTRIPLTPNILASAEAQHNLEITIAYLEYWRG